MTTKAGLTGLVAGLIGSIFLYFLTAISNDPGGSVAVFLFIQLFQLILAGAAGFTAVRWSKAAKPGRCVALGGLAGVLDGLILFSLWGAASAGTTYLTNQSTTDLVPMVVNQTMNMFQIIFISCGLGGAYGGWLASSRRMNTRDDFDMADPQMAMNASITALPASIVAAGVAAAVFPRLGMLTGYAAGLPGLLPTAAYDRPLEIALLLVLVAHLAVTLVVPHESRMSQHLCGMDEVKMAAFVGIGAAPLLAGLLLAVYPGSLSHLPVLIALILSTLMSLISLFSLTRLVLPKRASFPPHPEGGKKAEAVLFGSIAGSVASRLIQLCIGCGLMMVLPLYIAVISVLINLNFLYGAAVPVGPFAAQALVSSGLMAASSGVLILIYMVYLNLGRWFNHRTKQGK